MRRALVLSACAALALPPAAEAAPAVGAEDAAYSAITLRTSSGRVFDVQLLASRPTAVSSATTALLRVVVTARGGASQRFSAELPLSSVAVRGSTAQLRATLGGVPLVVSWGSQQYSYTVAFGDASSAAGGQGGWTAGGSTASSTIRLGSTTCRSTQGLIGTAIGHDTAAYGAAVGAAFGGASLQGARCLAEPVPASIP